LLFRKDKKHGKTLIGTPGKFDIINQQRGRPNRSRSQDNASKSKEKTVEPEPKSAPKSQKESAGKSEIAAKFGAGRPRKLLEKK